MRMGAKKRPCYRIVVADSRAPRDGRFIEVIGHYHPISKKLEVNKEQTISWLKKGAIPSSTVLKLFKSLKISI